jgi:predicted transcriptional regulator
MDSEYYTVQIMARKKLIALRINDSDRKALENLAKMEEETVSGLVRQAIAEFLERRQVANAR